MSNCVKAWDAPTRMFKWMFVLVVACGWATNKFAADHPDWHKWNGYLTLTLVIFRVLWGVMGGRTVRFSTFVARPKTVMRYIRSQFGEHPQHFLGHNPLGGWMVVTLLAAVTLQVVLGLFAAGGDYLDSIEGPFAFLLNDQAVAVVTGLHRVFFKSIIILVAIHVGANVSMDVVKRSGLIRSMITGKKPALNYSDAPASVTGSAKVAIACLIAAAAIVLAVLAFSNAMT